jgi:hypothetical protein
MGKDLRYGNENEGERHLRYRKRSADLQKAWFHACCLAPQPKVTTEMQNDSMLIIRALGETTVAEA